MHGFTNFSNIAKFEPRFTPLWTVFISSLLGVIILWTIIGNVLVLVTIVMELKINSSSNHLIFSLAITDLLVAVTVMPLSVIKELSVKWWLGLILCDIWIFLDVLSCTASIFHLVVIAIDRYLTITQLSYNRNRSLRSTSLMIASSWVAAIIVSVPSRFSFNRSNDKQAIEVEYNGTCVINQETSYTILANFLSFCFPLLVIGFIYIKIFVFILKQTKSRRSIINSAIGSDALTMALANEFSFSPGKDSNIVFDENSFETGFTESLEQSSWIEEILPSLSYADEDEEYAQKLSLLSPDEISNKNFNLFEKLSSNSFPVSSTISQSIYRSCSDFLRSTNIAQQEIVTTDDEDLVFSSETLGKSDNAKTLPYGKSIIKSPTSTSNKLRSPTLSWSPKLTFYSYRKANQNERTSPDICENTDSLSNQEKTPSSTKFGDANSNTFISMANKIKRVHQKREFRVARTLFILTGLFIVCWMPFAVNNLLRAYIFTTTNGVNLAMDSVFLWLGYINSGLNPIIYTVFSPDFQAAFKKIICGNNVEL